jgi:hypothetical protein
MPHTRLAGFLVYAHPDARSTIPICGIEQQSARKSFRIDEASGLSTIGVRLCAGRVAALRNYFWLLHLLAQVALGLQVG